MKKLTPFATGTLIVVAAFLWILSSVGEAATVQVDCSSGSLQAAIDKAKPGDTLLVSGTCKENLVIHEEVVRVTLDGQGKATINAPDTTKHTMIVRGRGITIKGFTVTGGRNGLMVNNGGQAIIDGNTIQGVRRGILVTSNSSARIKNNTIQNNSSSGITVAMSSFARIGNNTIQNNRRSGIVVTQSSSARIGNNTVKNNRIGIVIGNNSAGRVGYFRSGDRTASPNIIENNERNGIVVNFGSTARIVGNTIRNNERSGILVTRASALISSNKIDGNGRNGIMIRSSDASLGRRRGSGILQLPNSTTSKNSGAGVWCSGNSSVSGRLGSLNGEEEVKDIDPSCVDSLKP